MAPVEVLRRPKLIFAVEMLPGVSTVVSIIVADNWMVAVLAVAFGVHAYSEPV